jgi:hypothetical protein
MAAKRKKGPARTAPAQVPEPAPDSDRVTYRELRNTPGRVWERLNDDRPMTLVADGQPQALMIPLRGSDPAAAWDAYVRGRAALAASRIRRDARARGLERMSLDEINAVIREVREEHRARDRKR